LKEREKVAWSKGARSGNIYIGHFVEKAPFLRDKKRVEGGGLKKQGEWNISMQAPKDTETPREKGEQVSLHERGQWSIKKKKKRITE